MNKTGDPQDRSAASGLIGRGRGGVSKALVLIPLVAIVVTIGVGLWTWRTGIVARAYDYDEVQRAHSVWLASLGLRPYDDYFECHPPYFVLLTPLIRANSDPCRALLTLRIFAACGNLLFLGGLVAVASACNAKGRLWPLLGVAFVAFHPRILDFLVEYRIDGWGYALATWSLYAYRRMGDGRWRPFLLGLVSGIATLFFCPKLVLLPPLIVAFDLAASWRSRASAFRACALYLAGGAAAGLLFALFVLANGISLGRTLLLLGRYHAVSNANSAFRYGLLEQISATRVLLLPIAVGAGLYLFRCVRRRSLPDPIAFGLGVWLLLQALAVTYPYKQYYAPWFLFASPFVVLLGQGLSDFWKPLGLAAFVLSCGAVANVDQGLAQTWSRYGGAGAHCGLIRFLDRLSAPDDRVVAPPPYHPIDRRDAFFVWFNTSDPRGFDTEKIFETMSPLRRLVSVAHYRGELEANPPAFVVLETGGVPATYPQGQQRALIDFIRGRGYRIVRARGVRLALRPDRAERSFAEGLVE